MIGSFAYPIPVKAESSLQEGGISVIDRVNPVNIELLFAEPVKTIDIKVEDSLYMQSDEYKGTVSEDKLPALLKRIRGCESQGNPLAPGDYRVQNKYSTASGAFQIINGTWDNYGGYKTAKEAPKYLQDEKALIIYSSRGTRDWTSSQSCWGTKQVVRASLTVNSSVTLLYRDPASRYGSCVAFSKAQTGIYRSIGNGGRAGIQGRTPKVGSIGVMYGSPHAVVIIAINGNQVTFKESGYLTGWITERTLPTSQFMGYIYN